MFEVSLIPELVLHCLSFLDAHNIGQVQSLVNKQWYEYCETQIIWRDLTFNALGWPHTGDNQKPPSISPFITWKKFYAFLQTPSELYLIRNSFCRHDLLLDLIDKKLKPHESVTILCNEVAEGFIVAEEPLYQVLQLSKQLKESQTLAIDDIRIQEQHGGYKHLNDPQLTFGTTDRKQKLASLKDKMNGTREVKIFVLNNDTTNIVEALRVIQLAKQCQHQTADQVTYKAHLTGHCFIKKTTDYNEVERIVETLWEARVETSVRFVDTNPLDVVYSEFFDNIIHPVLPLPTNTNNKFEVLLFCDYVESPLELTRDISNHLAVNFDAALQLLRNAIQQNMIVRLFRGDQTKADQVASFFQEKGYPVSVLMCDPDLQEDYVD